MHRVYLDNNATTPVLPEVFEAMRPFFSERFGNASSIHQQGQETRAAVEDARESVADLLGCSAAEIVFTSGGTESDNLAIAGWMAAGDHVITSSIEHHAVLHACKHLEKIGCDVTILPVDGRGLIDPSDVRRALQPNTKLISVMMANNESGVLQPVEEIGKIASEASVLFHTDAVQAAAKVPVQGRQIGCDALSISGHKIHAPQGVGALYVKKGTRIQPLFHGGRHERSRRAGTENVPGIVGLGKAAEIAKQALDRGDPQKMAAMRDRLEHGILAQVDEAGVNGAGAPRVPNTTNIHFDHIEGESLVIALDLKGLAVSTGAACSSGAIEPSHVLIAMGLRPDQARASIRFSLGKQTTESDIDYALSLVPETVARLRAISPKYKKQAVSMER
ncbi:MAG TPA: aminotransferase class V-fold PLP-dependent enzyme [Candidatus Sulfotelmatobacter sp.]|nr:aminotransferase class V-fold PLP-dependent enzyme [Candidatus Sulfotelmatobacter sp.]